MSGSTQYTVASNAAYDGTKCPHPDVSIGSGVDIAATANVGATPTMATLAAAMQGTPGFYSRELLKDSDITVINPGVEFGLISFYRDFPLARFFPHVDGTLGDCLGEPAPALYEQAGRSALHARRGSALRGLPGERPAHGLLPDGQ